MFAVGFGGDLALDTIITLLHIVAIGLTLLRLYYRRSTSRLGWDDFTAALAVLLDCAYFSVMWPFFSTTSARYRLHISEYSKYWLNLELFLAIACLCRMSIALAITRVFPAKERMRKVTLGLAAVFGLMFLTFQTTIICSSKYVKPAPSSGSIECKWTDLLRVTFVIINITLDCLLVGIPLYSFWRVRLPTRQRMLVLAGFAASSITTLGAIVCAVLRFAPHSWEPARSDLQIKINFIEAAICVAACNLLVVLTYFDNVRRRDLDSDDRSLHQTRSPDTRQSRGPPPPPHSNQMPPSDVLSTLVLTEITDAFVTIERGNSGSQAMLSSSSFVTSSSVKSSSVEVETKES